MERPAKETFPIYVQNVMWFVHFLIIGKSEKVAKIKQNQCESNGYIGRTINAINTNRNSSVMYRAKTVYHIRDRLQIVEFPFMFVSFQSIDQA